MQVINVMHCFWSDLTLSILNPDCHYLLKHIQYKIRYPVHVPITIVTQCGNYTSNHPPGDTTDWALLVTFQFTAGDTTDWALLVTFQFTAGDTTDWALLVTFQFTAGDTTDWTLQVTFQFTAGDTTDWALQVTFQFTAISAQAKNIH